MNTKKIICAVVAVLLVGAIGSAMESEGDGNTADESTNVAAETVAEDAQLAFKVTVGQSLDSLDVEQVLVTVSAALTDGTTVSKTYTAAPGQAYSLDMGAGHYAFAVTNPAEFNGAYVLAETSTECDFDATESFVQELTAELDEDATNAAIATAAEEAAAQAQAEAEAEAAAKAQQEADEAAAQAAAEAAAQDQQTQAAAAAAASTASSSGSSSSEATTSSGSSGSSQNTSYTVYITKSGECYHADGCSSLKKSKIAISKSDAVARGYRACQKCNP
jgi:hypothetical protein